LYGLYPITLLYTIWPRGLYKCDQGPSDVTTTSEYVITISCTDGIDTTFFDLTLLFTSKDSVVTDKTDSTPIIIGASIGGLFIVLIVVIMVVFVRKRQHKHNDGSSVYETTLPLSNMDGHHYESVFQTGRS
jgi:hypothetical protein